MFRRSAPDAVYGRRIAEPRITGLGAFLAVACAVPPLLAFIALMELAFWALFQGVFGVCVSLACLL